MVIEKCEWLSSWYENSAFIKIPIKEFDISTLSFTYGDSHPTFGSRINDGKEYGKKLYLYDEFWKSSKSTDYRKNGIRMENSDSNDISKNIFGAIGQLIVI